MIKIVVCIFYIVTLINIVTFANYRIKNGGKAKLIVERPVRNGEKMTYCLPGLKSNAASAFRFLDQAFVQDTTLRKSGFTYIKYENTGFDVKTIANQIVDDIKTHNYQPVIISVSVGDQIARLVEREIKGVPIVAINPATNDECLDFWVQIKMRVELFFENFGITSIGWFGLLPICQTDGKPKQSLVLVNDMKNSLIKSRLEVKQSNTKAVFFSYFDKLLDNAAIYDIFGLTDAEAILVDTEHANLALGGILYRDDLIRVLKTIY